MANPLLDSDWAQQVIAASPGPIAALTAEELAAVILIRRRPELAEALAATSALISQHRQCRLIVEVSGGHINLQWYDPRKRILIRG